MRSHRDSFIVELPDLAGLNVVDVAYHLDKLLDDVEQIAGPGTPGGVCAFGADAFVVVTGKDGYPLVAGAVAGKGRALVMGHNGYLEKAAIETADTGPFFVNALRWLSGGKRNPRIICPGKPELAKALKELGMRAEVAASSS